MENDFLSNITHTIEDTNTFYKIHIDESDFDSNSFSIEKIFEYLEQVSVNDNFELRLEIDGNAVAIEKADDKSNIINHFNKIEKNSRVSFELLLEIKKRTNDGILPIYSFNSFMDFLEKKNFNECIELFSKIFSKRIIFRIYDVFEEDVYTNTIAFISSSRDIIYKNFKELNRKNKNQLLHENKVSSNIKHGVLLADDFNIKNGTNNRIEILFNNIKYLLSLSSIANEFNLNSNNTFDLKICGYKNIYNKNLTIDFFNDKSEILYKIYDWSYEGGNGPDKIGLVRNVLSLHLNEENNININHEVWDAVQSNYQIYLKENIQSYLEIKNKIGEFVLELSSKTYSMADDILNNFKNNILLLLTFIISVVVVNGIKDNGIEKIFSFEYLAVILFLSSLIIIWFCILKKEILNRFDKATSNIKSILVRNYSQVIMKSEITSTLKPVVLKNKTYLKQQIERFKKYLISILLFINIFFAIGIIIQNNRNFKVLNNEQSIESLLKDEKKYIKHLNMLNNEITESLIQEIEKAKLLNNKLIHERNNYKNKLDIIDKDYRKLEDSYKLIKNKMNNQNK